MAEEVLASHPGASRALRAVLTEIRESGKSADSVRLTISRCLTWVAIPAIATAVTPPPGHGFDVGAFVRGCGTLYMIAARHRELPDRAAVPRVLPARPPRGRAGGQQDQGREG